MCPTKLALLTGLFLLNNRMDPVLLCSPTSWGAIIKAELQTVREKQGKPSHSADNQIMQIVGNFILWVSINY